MLAGMGIVWGFLKLFGLCGVLSLLAFLVAIISFILAKLKHRSSLRPLWYSIAAVALGALGTAAGVFEAYLKAEHMGGAAAVGDLERDLLRAMVPLGAGVVMLIAGSVMIAILKMCAAPSEPEGIR
jgi:hypothetical protein